MTRNAKDKNCLPKIVTSLPGPKAKALIAKDKQYISSSYTRGAPVVAHRAYGAMIEDPDGNRFLDFSAGIAVNSTGHCHPNVVQAITEQASNLIHMSGTDFYYEPQIRLAETLARIAPGKSPKKIFFCNSGTEAIEASMKLARYYTKRPRFIAFQGAFHGRTFGGMSLSCSKVVHKKYFAPLLGQIDHIPYANCTRCMYNLTYPKCEMHCVRIIEEYYFKHVIPPEEVAAIVVEAIQGEGGYVVPPPEFHQSLKKLAEKYKILYVVDEVQSGMGRTGKMFAIEHWGIEPDILASAKGIASGLPLGAIIARADVMNWEPGTHASTFGGNPVACAAANATIQLLESELMDNAKKMGDILIKAFRQLMKKYTVIGDVRGHGLMIGIEFVKDRRTMEQDPKLRDAVVDEAYKYGLILLGCGYNTLRLCPPLVVNREQCEFVIETITRCLETLVLPVKHQ
ncbi:MAG: acetyl ornithine aminotransferase family protein [Candidatus Riflebacteria bacterium]|nr:acetyl ornithine aminotransferase family protein [Candidatus Riflebacteria bacterium]